MLKCAHVALMRARKHLRHSSVDDVDELRQRLTKVWHGLGQSVIDDAMDEWHARLWACIHVKIAHYGQLA